MLDTFNFCVYYITCVREKPNEQHNIICASGSVVEHLLAKEGVAGSIPVSRSQENKTGYPNGYPVLFFFESNPGLEGSNLLRFASVIAKPRSTGPLDFSRH